MPFLGNTPANTFVSIAKQTITGNGGTSYTLSYPVTNANEIDVFYNNVRQEPTAAYTASGTTITFTEAIQSTDSVYVIFNGQAIGTIDAPAGAYLPTTGGTINGNVGILRSSPNAALEVGGSWRLGTNISGAYTGGLGGGFNSNNNIYSVYCRDRTDTNWNDLWIESKTLSLKSNGSNTAIYIDQSGRVTLPYQPVFKAGASSTISTTGTGQAIAFQDTSSRYACNVGGHYSTSTGRFTAPIAGKYIFYAQLLGQSLGGGDNTEIYLDVNGGLQAIGGRMSYQNEYTGEGGYIAMTITSTFLLAANDYVSVSWYRQGSSGTIHGNTAWSYFTGYLLG